MSNVHMTNLELVHASQTYYIHPIPLHSERKLKPVPREIARKKTLRILLGRRPGRLPHCVRRQGRPVPAAQPVAVDALLQLEQRRGRPDAEARVAVGVGRPEGRDVVGVLGQRDVHLLARGANVEPEELLRLGDGHGPRGQAQRVGVEGLGEREGVIRDGDVDVVQARDEGARGRVFGVVVRGAIIGRGGTGTHDGGIVVFGPAGRVVIKTATGGLAGIFAQVEENAHEVTMPAAQGLAESFKVNRDGSQAFDFVDGLGFGPGFTTPRGCGKVGLGGGEGGGGGGGGGGGVAQSPAGDGGEEISHL